VRKTKRRRINADREVPEGITQLIIDEILALPGDDFKTRHLKSEFLKKFVSDDTDPPELRRSRAIEKWLATEERNAETNDRLINHDPEFQILPGVESVTFFDFARRVVQGILGDTVPEAAFDGPFSGGASTSRPRTSSRAAGKYLGKADVTDGALTMIEPLLAYNRGWVPYWLGASDALSALNGWSADWTPYQFDTIGEANPLSLNVVPGNVLFTVPKSTDIDRCACKEPDINMFLQKGVGKVMRRRLLRVGIDLSDQSRNRYLAKLGSEDGTLCTVDLSSASDSVTLSLVELLLPEMWFHHLMALRSRTTNIDGVEHVNEMFSSMGNGFTFELQTVIYYSLARAVSYFNGERGIVSVYGDDIIAPSRIYRDLEFVLSFCGFKVNPDKSFWEGPFRESCGGHYVNGLDVTPFYVRGPVRRLSDLINICNQLRKWSETDISINDVDIWPLWSFLSSFVPKRFWGGRRDATRYQLYSPGHSDRVLHPIVQKKSAGVGGYLFWLSVCSNRTSPGEPIETSYSSTVDPLVCETRRARRTVTGNMPLFLEEL